MGIDERSADEALSEVQLFLAHAIELEREAARCYQQLAAHMAQQGNAEVAQFFCSMAVFARRHLEEAMLRGGFHETPHLDPTSLRWVSGTSPETPAWDTPSGDLDLQGALVLALEGEHRGLRFYANVSERSADPQVRQLAAEFAAEESEHVLQLQSWFSRAPAAQ